MTAAIDPEYVRRPMPPFNTLHAQVIQKGPHPQILNGSQVSVSFSAAASPYDNVFNPTNPQPARFNQSLRTCIPGASAGQRNQSCSFDDFLAVFKTNFWNDPIPKAPTTPSTRPISPAEFRSTPG